MAIIRLNKNGNISANEFDEIIVGSGLVGYWTFNGNGTDASGSNYHAIVSGSDCSYTSDIYGSYVSLNSVDARNKISVPNTSNQFEVGEHTFFFRFKPDQYGTTGSGKYFLNHFNWRFVLTSGSQVRFTVGRLDDPVNGPTASVDSLANIVLGSWYSIAGEYFPDAIGSTGYIKMYVNGTYIASTSLSGSIIAPSYGIDLLEWGNSNHGVAEPFVGSFDETRIYNRILTPEEHMLIGKHKTSFNKTGSEYYDLIYGSGLVGKWTFSNNVLDTSINNNNGTLTHGSIILAHYLFNNNFNDSSSYGKNLTVSNMTYGPGYIGSAGYFNGTNSFGSITTVTSISGKSSQTQAAWIKLDDLSSNRTISSFSGTNAFSVLPTGSLQWEGAGSFGATGAGRFYNTNGSKINVGSWYHVAVVQHTNMPPNQAVDIRDVDFYINGSITNKAVTLINNITSSNTSFLVGAYSSTSLFFSGSMSDFRLYQSTLNVDEIGSIYNGGVGTQSEFTDEDFIPGYFGSCLRFHRNSVIPIGNPTNLQFGSQHDFTFSLWAQPWASGNRTAMGLFSRSFIAGLDISGVSGSAGVFRFGVRLASSPIMSSSATQNFVIGSWYHVVGVHDATARTVQVFVNGSANATQSVAALSWVNGGTLSIGGTNALSGNSSAYFGLIDDVRIYNRVLGSEEIKYLYFNNPLNSRSIVYSREILENQSLTGSSKMSLQQNKVYIVGELLEV